MTENPWSMDVSEIHDYDYDYDYDPIKRTNAIQHYKLGGHDCNPGPADGGQGIIREKYEIKLSQKVDNFKCGMIGHMKYEYEMPNIQDILLYRQ